ncbi:MAG: hypothetical protein K2X72_09250 [Reyranella sp.]|nr:hypothetical protein [Reyranella sp.]
MTNWKTLPSAALLKLHADIAGELRDRGILRSSNNPTADVAEHLFCRAFGWIQAGNSHPSADATCAEGKLYQIKGRRLTPQNASRELSALRRLSDGGFHYLAAVLFAPDYSVTRAAIIPHELVLKNSVYVKHTNAWRFLLRDASWTWPGVRDVTEELRVVKL